MRSRPALAIIQAAPPKGQIAHLVRNSTLTQANSTALTMYSTHSRPNINQCILGISIVWGYIRSVKRPMSFAMQPCAKAELRAKTST